MLNRGTHTKQERVSIWKFTIPPLGVECRYSETKRAKVGPLYVIITGMTTKKDLAWPPIIEDTEKHKPLRVWWPRGEAKNILEAKRVVDLPLKALVPVLGVEVGRPITPLALLVNRWWGVRWGPPLTPGWPRGKPCGWGKVGIPNPLAMKFKAYFRVWLECFLLWAERS